MSYPSPLLRPQPRRQFRWGLFWRVFFAAVLTVATIIAIGTIR